MKLYSGACERNKLPIAEALSAIFRTPGLVLEVASGTGMHAEYFARQLPHLQWQPSDVDEQALSSIQAWRAESGANNLRPPIVLDVAHGALTLDLSDEQVVGMFNANMVHISPWSATLGLFRCAGQLLTSGGAISNVWAVPYRRTDVGEQQAVRRVLAITRSALGCPSARRLSQRGGRQWAVASNRPGPARK